MGEGKERKGKEGKGREGWERKVGKGSPNIKAMLTYETVPINDVKPHPRNPKRGDVDAIAASVTANGVYRPITVQQSTGLILAGNHTWKALKKLKHKQVSVCYVDVDDDTALRILIADNRTAEVGGYDEAALASLLAAMLEEGNIGGTGYSEDDVRELLASMDQEDDGPNAGETAERLLHALSASIADPTHKVAPGEVYLVAGRHYAVCAEIVAEERGWEVWAPLLVKGEARLFVPHAGPYVFATKKSQSSDLVCVSPDPYVVGHQLDNAANLGMSVELQ